MKKLLGIVVLVLFLSGNAYADLGELVALMNWKHLKIECSLKNYPERAKYEIKITEKIIIQRKWDYAWWTTNFQIVKATDDIVRGIKKRPYDKSTIDYIEIDRNKSTIEIGWYVINLKNEKVFYNSDNGNCVKDLN